MGTRLREPYVGPRPFEREDRDLFFGRDREANELLSLITAHQAVLLYSRSGAGKSSLLNTKLVPLLEEDGFKVLPTARVRGVSTKEITTGDRGNIYIFNALASMDENKIDLKHLAQLSFEEFLQEEDRASDEFHSPHVIIFDQFEELFTFFPERWRDRRDFFEQVGKALTKYTRLRMVFAMREDYIAEVDPYVRYLPEKLQTRFRLEPLREGAALAAVTGPLRDENRRFGEGVAEALVDNLLQVSARTSDSLQVIKGEFIEPVQLQVVCRSLWQNLHYSEDKIITHEHLKSFGDVNQALSGFYEKTIRRASETGHIKEGVLRRWFEQVLITPAGTRGSVFQGPGETGGIANAIVEELEKQHLITGEWRGGTRWYELTHDRLIEPILESNRKWLLAYTGAEQTRQRLEARATEWINSGRSNQYLFDEAELFDAERWLTSPDADELGYSESLRSLVQLSRTTIEKILHLRELEQAQALAEAQRQRAEVERKRVRQRGWGLIALSALVLIVCAMTVFA